jgi:gamma-glutamyltranspeptidase/glutathione hydrolase
VIAGGTGFLMDDEMDDFTVKPGLPNMFGLVQGVANVIAPGKRPLSSRAPTIILRDGQLRLVTGSPGRSRFITIVLKRFLNMIDHDMTAQKTGDAARLHLQWLPDLLYAERFALSPDVRQALTRGAKHAWGRGGDHRQRYSGASRGRHRRRWICHRPSRCVRRVLRANDRRRSTGAALAP